MFSLLHGWSGGPGRCTQEFVLFQASRHGLLQGVQVLLLDSLPPFLPSNDSSLASSSSPLHPRILLYQARLLSALWHSSHVSRTAALSSILRYPQGRIHWAQHTSFG